MLNVQWRKAKYQEGEMSSKALVTVLNYVGLFKDKYHVFEGVGGTKYVVFDNQSRLLNYVKKYSGSLFAIGLLEGTNSKFSYAVTDDDGGAFVVYTVARAAVLIEGTPEEPVRQYNGLSIIE